VHWVRCVAVGDEAPAFHVAERHLEVDPADVVRQTIDLAHPVEAERSGPDRVDERDDGRQRGWNGGRVGDLVSRPELEQVPAPLRSCSSTVCPTVRPRKSTSTSRRSPGERSICAIWTVEAGSPPSFPISQNGVPSLNASRNTREFAPPRTRKRYSAVYQHPVPVRDRRLGQPVLQREPGRVAGVGPERGTGQEAVVGQALDSAPPPRSTVDGASVRV